MPLPSDDQQPGLVAAGAARDHVDPVGHHEGRIEADAELADQLRALAGLAGFDAFHERLRAGARDGAERLDHLVAAHADAVVLDRRACLLVRVERERDARLRVVAEQCRLGDRLVAQLLAGIGGVRDQLAQEDVLVGIDRMHHQVQQLGDVGLESAVFDLGFFSNRHGKLLPLRAYEVGHCSKATLRSTLAKVRRLPWMREPRLAAWHPPRKMLIILSNFRPTVPHAIRRRSEAVARLDRPRRRARPGQALDRRVRTTAAAVSYRRVAATSPAGSPRSCARAASARNDRVALLANNSIEHLLCYFGVMAYGATICTVHVEMNRNQLDNIFARLKPKLVLYQDGLRPRRSARRRVGAAPAARPLRRARARTFFAEVARCRAGRRAAPTPGRTTTP